MDWETLVRRWAMDYDFMKANALTTYLEPRGSRVLFDRLREADFRYAVTGSFAAVRLAPVAEPRLVTLYADDPRPLLTGSGCVLLRPEGMLPSLVPSIRWFLSARKLPTALHTLVSLRFCWIL